MGGSAQEMKEEENMHLVSFCCCLFGDLEREPEMRTKRFFAVMTVVCL